MKIKSLDATALGNYFKGKKILIVGGTSGLGRAIAISAMEREAQVSIVGRRTPDDALSKATFIQKDLTLMKSAQEIKATSDLDVIIFTNGIICSPEREETAEGIEKDLAVSYLSRLAISRSFGVLKPTTKVFVMGYPGQDTAATVDDFNSEKNYKPFAAHMNTVVGNEALVTFIADTYKVKTYGLNPGLIYTEIRDRYLGKGTWKSWFVESLIKAFNPTAKQYAEEMLHVIASPELDELNKSSFDPKRKLLKPNPFLLKDDNLNRIMKASNELLDKALQK